MEIPVDSRLRAISRVRPEPKSCEDWIELAFAAAYAALDYWKPGSDTARQVLHSLMAYYGCEYEPFWDIHVNRRMTELAVYRPRNDSPETVSCHLVAETFSVLRMVLGSYVKGIRIPDYYSRFAKFAVDSSCLAAYNHAREPQRQAMNWYFDAYEDDNRAERFVACDLMAPRLTAVERAHLQRIREAHESRTIWR